MKSAIIFCLFVLCISVQAQDYKKLEHDLLKSIKKINAFETSSGESPNASPWDSLKLENEILRNKLLTYTSKYPGTLEYDFQELRKENFYIATSEDKKFRIYSWDTFAGGTTHYFENIYQYKSDKVYSANFDDHRSQEDFGGFYSEIFTLDTNGRKIYLAYFHAIYSDKDGFQAIQPFEINKNVLNDKLPLIKTKSGMTDKLGFDFDLFSALSSAENPAKLIYFDNKGKLIKLPVIAADGKITNRFVSYQFTGQYFERQKN